MSNVSLEIILNDHNYQKIRSMINNPDLHTSVGDIIWSQNKLLSDMDIVLDYLNRRIRTVSNQMIVSGFSSMSQVLILRYLRFLIITIELQIF